jgi:hypothetical protein
MGKVSLACFAYSTANKQVGSKQSQQQGCVYDSSTSNNKSNLSYYYKQVEYSEEQD